MVKKDRKIKNSENGKNILEENLEQFILEQLEEYVRLHKEHEKDFVKKYIG